MANRRSTRQPSTIAQLALSVALAPRASRRPKQKNVQPRYFKTVGLFAGIGGIEFGLSAAGHEAVLFCANDKSAPQ